MGFYFLSPSSILLLGLAYAALGVVFWVIARTTKGMQTRMLILGVVGVSFLILPIAEELWIAWHFGQACKSAGTFIHRTVRVDGFYDDTGASLDLVRSGEYIFIEGRSNKGVTRVTFGNPEFMNAALERFRQQNPSKDPLAQEMLRIALDDKTEALVYPKRGDSWRIIHLDRPTARYHFRNLDPIGGTPWTHKVLRSGSSVVVDTKTNEEMARYVSFGRKPPWFFIGRDTPGFGCDAPQRWPYTRGSGLIYREALIPTSNKK